jgi:hypothetical protein
MVHMVAYLTKTYNVLASFVINTYHIGIHIVPTSGEKTWEKNRSKDIYVLGVEDKRQLLLQYPLELMEIHCFYK